MYILAFITASSQKEASNIARALVKNKLAACVNILGKVRSFFWWQGKIERADEALLIIKSKKTKLPRIIKLVRAMHSYQVPEIITLPITGGYKPYLRWIDASVR